MMINDSYQKIIKAHLDPYLQYVALGLSERFNKITVIIYRPGQDAFFLQTLNFEDIALVIAADKTEYWMRYNILTEPKNQSVN